MTHPEPHVPDPNFIHTRECDGMHAAPNYACNRNAPKPRPPREPMIPAATPFKLPCCGTPHAGYLDGLVDYVTDHLRNCMVFRNDITIRTCPAALGSNIRMGDANTTHHLIPQRVGTMRGEPVHEHRCVSCGQKAVHLKSDSAIEAAIVLIIDHVKAGA